MSAHAYPEDQLVEQRAIGLFSRSWAGLLPSATLTPARSQGERERAALVCSPLTVGTGVGGEGAALVAPLLGRETTSEVVLKPRLEAALRRLNPALPPEAITAAVDELTRDRSAMSLEAEREMLFCFNSLLIASNGTDSRGGEVEGLTYGPVVTGNMEIRNLVQP